MNTEFSPEVDNHARAADGNIQPINLASLEPAPDVNTTLSDPLVVADRGDGRTDGRRPVGDRTPRPLPHTGYPHAGHPHGGHPHRGGDRSPVRPPAGHQQIPQQTYDQRFRRPQQTYISNIDQQRLEQLRRQQRMQQYGNQYSGGANDIQYQQWLASQRQRQLQQQQYGRYQGYPQYASYQQNFVPWQGDNYMSGPWGNQWDQGYHDHYHRRRRGPDIGNLIGLLGGAIATGAIIDQIGRQTERSERRSQTTQDQVTSGRDDTQAREPRDRQRNQDPERSEPFTAKSRANREGWSEEHGALIERARNNRGQTVVYGDGNTKLLANNESFRNLGWQEFGIRHDRTENLLYRLRHGEANFNRENPPRNAVLMIGTNNIGRASTDDIVRGIMENHRELRTRLPNARIAVVGVLPKGNDATDNQQIQEVNRKLQEQLRDKPNTVFVDPRPALTRNGERIPEMWQPAGIHLSTQGQNKLLEQINTRLRPTTPG